jgi:glycosyltransferase involved in cell wall biosynthesis
MRISVVIPAFNEARWLPLTLTRLAEAARQYPASVEVIVVDNASDDATADVARAAGATVIQETEHNVGLVRNRGAAAATGEVFGRRDAFERLAGYDESQYMGEDVDFFWRLRRLARRTGGDVTLLAEVEVEPSTRRFDQWPLWRTLVWTNPLVIELLRRRRWAGRGWYSPAVPRLPGARAAAICGQRLPSSRRSRSGSTHGRSGSSAVCVATTPGHVRTVKVSVSGRGRRSPGTGRVAARRGAARRRGART